MIKNRQIIKYISLFLVVAITSQVFFPTFSFALTSGPHAPEFSSFEPVNTNQMVDVFTGDFTYNLPVINIPGPDGGGYAMSLSYHSGVSSEEEASWVGLGWSLNPGAISRNKRGYPDDYNGAKIKKINKTVPNWTLSATADANFEFFSESLKETNNDGNGDTSLVSLKEIGSISASRSVRFNNYRGFSRTFGFGLGVMGMASLNFEKSGTGWTKDISINPQEILKGRQEYVALKVNNRLVSERQEVNKSNTKYSSLKQNVLSNLKQFRYNLYTDNVQPVSVQKYKGLSFNYSPSIGVNFYGPVGMEFGYSENFNIQKNPAVEEFNAYGFMFPQDIRYSRGQAAFDEDGCSYILSDYAIDKANNYSKRDHYLGAPLQMDDVFLVNGEGLNGGIRLFHKKTGHFFPNYVRSMTGIASIGPEVAFGETIEFGLTLGGGRQKNEVTEYFSYFDNTALYKNRIVEQFPQDQKPFFRFNNDLGGNVSYSTEDTDQPRALDLPFLLTDIIDINGEESKVGRNLKLDKNGLDERDTARSALVEYRLFDEIKANNDNRFEKSKNILDILDNQDEPEFIIPEKALCEIKVKNASGNTYIYGLPVFTKDEKNYSIQVGQKNRHDDYNYLAYKNLYTNGDKLENRIIVGEESPVPYAMNHLLTQITTSGYVDVFDSDITKGPGNEDIGGWTKFWYRQWESESNKKWFRHRSPYNGLYYNQGALFNEEDDMGSVSSGLKQKYYLKAVETKTHVAFFITNKTKRSDFADFIVRNSESGVDINQLSFIPVEPDPDNARKDGFGAPYEDIIDGKERDPAANDQHAQDDQQKIEKLEKIVLCSKKQLGQPLQVTNFEYDYSLCENVANSEVKHEYSDGERSRLKTVGKLTLKRVWFEYNGVVKSKIAPYEFSYLYKQYVTADSEQGKQDLIDANHLYSKYEDIITFADKYDDNSQNPEYKPAVLDMWGNNSANREELTKNKYPWVSQKNEEGFDPAAWNLKQITLPSGGEIHIQYEQKDYSFVQDKQALAMVSLKAESNNEYKPKETKYYLKPEDVGIDESEMELENHTFSELTMKQILNDASIRDKVKRYIVDNISSFPHVFDSDNQLETFLEPSGIYSEEDSQNDQKTNELAIIKEKTNVGLHWVKKLRKYFIEEKNFIYFKFLYSLNGDKSADFDNCKSEYISGYTEVHDVDIDTQGIFLKLGDKKSNKDNVPRTACREYYFSNAGGMLVGDNCNCEFLLKDQMNDLAMQTAYGGEFAEGVLRLIMAIPAFAEIPFHLIVPSKGKNWVCRKYNEKLSYLRVPLPYSKKGGGCRVKRLLMYDKGIESGDESLFGSEYIYELPDGTSSGVATNEPAGGREENALVTLLDHDKQGRFSRFMNGMELRNHEGPIGEPLLPAPAIGYSRVIVQGIHSGKTNTGYIEHGFNTAKTHPMIVQKTNLDGSKHNKRLWLNLNLGIISFSMDNFQVSQGYSIIHQNKHGTPSVQEAFAGRYDPINNRSNVKVSSSEYEYFDFAAGEKMKMMQYDPKNYRLSYFEDTPGKEETVTMEMKRVFDQTVSFSAEFDIWFQTSTFFPGFSLNTISLAYNERKIKSHTNTKVFSYPSIVKKVTNFHENVESVTENLAFDPYTGNSVLTKTTDGYDNLRLSKGNKGILHNGGYYALQIPASWIYRYMGPACKDDDNQNRLNEMAATVTTYGDEGNWLKKINESTDVISPDNPQKYYSLSPSQIDDLGVLSANVMKYKNNWFSNADLGELNKYKVYLNKIYRVHSNYTYKDEALIANWEDPDDDNRVYNGGILNDFDMFNTWWSPNDWYGGEREPEAETNQKWLKSTEVKKYSVNGVALEEKDILGIYSSAKYGYNDLLPVMISQNSPYSSIFFDDFENNAEAQDIKDNPMTYELNAHSGFNALNYSNNSNYTFLKHEDGIVVGPQLIKNGATLKFWLHSFNTEYPTDENDAESFVAVVNGVYNQKVRKIASTGFWSLYEAKLEMFSQIPEGESISIQLDYPVNAHEQVLIDDFRFQPLDASATCSVYDRYNLRLLAQFDNQHFGVYYQYNDEGQLVRKIIETERGPKTIQETHYNIEQKVER